MFQESLQATLSLGKVGALHFAGMSAAAAIEQNMKKVFSLSSSPSAMTDRWHSNPSSNRNNQTPICCLSGHNQFTDPEVFLQLLIIYMYHNAEVCIPIRGWQAAVYLLTCARVLSCQCWRLTFVVLYESFGKNV